MTPIFVSKNLNDTGYPKTLGNDKEHLKLFVKQSSRNFGTDGFNAIGFGLGKKLNIAKDRKPFDAVYSIEENEWNGKVSLQLQLRDIRE